MCNSKVKESDILAALEVCKSYNQGSIDEHQYLFLLRLSCAKCNAPTITPAEKNELLNKSEIKICIEE